MTETTVQQAYKFVLDPTPRKQRALASHAGGARYAYNWGLAQVALALDAYAAEKATGVEKPTTTIPGHFDLCKAWTRFKDDPASEVPWVGENFVGTYQAALRDAAVAWRNFFASRSGKRAGRRMGRPRFKSKHRSAPAFQVHGTSLRMVDGSHINLPKIGTVKIAGKVRLPGFTDRNARTARKLARAVRKGRARLVRATITRSASGAWWCSVTAEVQRDIPTGPTRRQRTNGTLGLDVGVRDLAVDSHGRVYPNPRQLDAALADLRAAQRALSRTRKDSRRREKARRRVGAIHERVRLQRKDALDRITTDLARNYALIGVEGWDVQQVMRDGSKAVPRQLRRDRNRGLADAAIGIARWQLEYKTSWYGSALIKGDPQQETGRTCSACGQVRAKPVPLADEQFSCPSCGHRLPRRVNTARVMAQTAARHGPPTGGPAKPRGEGVRPGAARRDGQPSAKRAARTQPHGRDQTGTPDP
jgi:putative transposase